MEDTMADEATQETAVVETSDDNTTEAPATEATTETEAPEAPGLGDAGKKALDAMKAERNEAKKQARELSDRLAALEAKLNGKEAEHQAAQEAQRIQDEALAKANERILKAEVRAAAAGKLSDPADALRFLDLSEFEVGSDGEVDGESVASAIDSLIKSKPYLSAQGKRFEGTADGGARNDANTVSQLTQSDMDRMSPEQIAEAESKGQFDRLLGRT
jgi:hypothetical protein